MINKSFLLYVVAASLMLPTGLVQAADQQRDQIGDKIQDQKQDQKPDRIYGSQIMTRQERIEYRARLRAAKTAEEREQIRRQHHERMKERAKAKGLALPDDPPARGGGMGPGGGSVR